MQSNVSVISACLWKGEVNIQPAEDELDKHFSLSLTHTHTYWCGYLTVCFLKDKPLSEKPGSVKFSFVLHAFLSGWFFHGLSILYKLEQTTFLPFALHNSCGGLSVQWKPRWILIDMFIPCLSCFASISFPSKSFPEERIPHWMGQADPSQLPGLAETCNSCGNKVMVVNG